MAHGFRGNGSTRPAWWCYFLLGAGILAPWNAFITATDYFTAMFPGAHVDRLFTVSYLPSCLLLLVLCVGGGARVDRWLGAPRTRVAVCYAAFTAVMLLVPLVDALGSAWRQEQGPPPGALIYLMITVVAVGALDGGCQGAVWSDAAGHGAEYTQAVAAGTACSGLLVSLLRCACKAAWLASASPPTSALRASTALYFILGAGLTAACWVVHRWVLPRLLPDHRLGHISLQHHRPSDTSCSEETVPTGLDCNQHVMMMNGEHDLKNKVHGGANCTRMELAVRCGGEAEGGGTEGSTRSGLDGINEAVRGNEGGLSGEGERAPLLAGPARPGTLGAPVAGLPAGRPLATHVPMAPAPSKAQDNEDMDDAAALESLLGLQQQPSDSWQQEAGQQLLHLHQRHSHHPLPSSAGLRGHMGAGGHLHADDDESHHPARLRAAWAVLWPYCVSLFITYCVTLSIFPGFLAEDVHSAELGEWYALIVITSFNAADMAGKLMLPPASQFTHTPSLHGGDNASHTLDSLWGSPKLFSEAAVSPLSPDMAGVRRLWSGLLHSPAWLSAARGAVMLTVFLCAAGLGAPPWFIITATVALGLSNGWLTVVAMASGPSLLSGTLATVGEGLLVVSLVAGLLAGALTGWLWLIPGQVK